MVGTGIMTFRNDNDKEIYINADKDGVGKTTGNVIFNPTFGLPLPSPGTNPDVVIERGRLMIENNNPIISSSYILNVSGNVYATSYSSASDYRIKKNVQLLDERFTIDDLKPVHYLNTKTGKQDIGLIAHELQEIFPELVNGKKDDEELQAINYIGLIPILIKEIQELKRKLQFIQ